MKWLNRILRSSEIETCLYTARCASHRAVACARRSIEADDGWATAARKWRAARDAAMWEARHLAG